MKENPVTILQRWKEDMITWKFGYRFKVWCNCKAKTAFQKEKNSFGCSRLST
jgi:hypothetical protein